MSLTITLTRPDHANIRREWEDVPDEDSIDITPQEADLAISLVPQGENPSEYRFQIGNTRTDYQILREILQRPRSTETPPHTSTSGGVRQFLQGHYFIGFSNNLSSPAARTYQGGAVAYGLIWDLTLLVQVGEINTVYGGVNSDSQFYSEVEPAFFVKLNPRRTYENYGETLDGFIQFGPTLAYGHSPGAIGTSDFNAGLAMTAGIELIALGRHIRTSIPVSIRGVRGTNDFSFQALQAGVRVEW